MLRLAGLPLAGLAAACSPAVLANALVPRSGLEVQAGLVYARGPERALDLYLPRGRAPRSLVVFGYGGSWQNGRRGLYPFVAEALTSLGHAVAVPDYRQWPAARWPVFLEDCAAAVAWLAGPEGRAAGVPAVPLVLLGHSAGAFNMAALALDARWLTAAGLAGGPAGIAGFVGLAGPYAFTPRRPPFPEIFAAAPGGLADVVPEVAAGGPPLLLLHGDADTTVEPSNSERLAARVTAAGGRATLRLYPGVGHLGIVAALAAPLRALGLEAAPVRRDVAGWLEQLLG